MALHMPIRKENSMKTKLGTKIGLAVLALSVAATAPALASEKGKWMIGDLHNHTTFTDGSWPMNDLIAPDTIAPKAVKDISTLYKQGTAATAFRNGLDFFANSEHGGVRERDGFGNAWTTYSPLPSIGDPNPSSSPKNMWRWQSLIRTSDIPGYSGPTYMGAYDWIQTIRTNYPQKIVMTGMEWNVPGHEHGSTGIVARNALPIAEFEYRFDSSDTDGTLTPTTATTMGWPGKIQTASYVPPEYPDYSAVLGLNSRHNKTIDGVKWMQANYPKTSYAIPAHVERAGCGAYNTVTGKWDNGASGSNASSSIGYSIAAFRDMNDNAPTVAFGIEGLPGHEKATNRGEFSATACGGGTYGGAGKYIAEVSGLWDNLLADGRKFFNFDSSDFHDPANDFWPGEYAKTYVMVEKGEHGHHHHHYVPTFTQRDVVDGLRSGNAFSVHGDLINVLEFKVFSRKSSDATMGETLSVKKGQPVTVQIRFKSPADNNCKAGVNASAGYVCAAPAVHHVQLIQGQVNPTRASKFLADGVTPNPDYNYIDPNIAHIAETFDASSWKVDRQGYTTMSFVIPKTRDDMFFRIRGTNLGYNVLKTDAAGKTIYGTDAAGSPLINTPGTNNADFAWDDLWFYSNPIFVNVR